MDDYTSHVQDNAAIYGGVALLAIIGLWFIFKKADQPGWAAIIPFYNYIVLLKVVGKPWWWLFLLLVPVVNLIFLIWIHNLLAKSFGKSELFTVGLVLLTPIFYLILGLGDAEYQGPAGAESGRAFV